MKPTGWETENIPVTPQGAQLRKFEIEMEKGHVVDCCEYAEAAERIEKLEREKQLHAGDTLSLSNELDEWKERAQDAERERDGNLNSWGKERYELMAERDTALRALAEARRDAAELRKIAERMLGWHNAPQDCYSTGPVHGDARDASCPSCELVSFLKHIDSASQPEKDANNG